MRSSLFWKTHIKDNFLCNGIASMEKIWLGKESSIRRRISYFEKKPLLREENFIRTRDFDKEKPILLEKKTSIQRRKSYFEKRLSIKRRKSYFEKRLLLREEHLILERDFYEEKTILFWKETSFKRRTFC